MSIKGRTIDVGGLEFNVLVDGVGPDVLLVHGFPDSNSVWRNQIPALVEVGYRVIAPDLRGFGESPAPPNTADYKIDRFVADLIGILDALGVRTVRLVGHDWGAAVGWQTCIEHPERIDRYAAIAVGHPSAYAQGGVVQKLKAYYVLFFQIPGLSEKAVSAANWWLWRQMLRYDPEMRTWKRDLSRPGRLTAAISIYRANLNLILPKQWPKVTVPVMGVWGQGDVALAERQMIESWKYVTGPWRYERVEGGTHWTQLERPSETNELLLDFLADGAPDQPARHVVEEKGRVMKPDKTQIVLGAAFFGAFAAFWRWHSPKVKPLTKHEIDHYLEIAAKLPLPEGHMDPIIESLRTWAEADDGKPVHMLNMIRYFDENKRWPGAPDFHGTPEEANAYYEKSVTPLWLKHASYPMVGGKAQGQNLIKTLPDQDPWSTAQMVRYPSRRTFLELLADPSYAPYEPYKFMALEIDLVPVSGDKVIPDARWLVGGALLALFQAVGWSRAARG